MELRPDLQGLQPYTPGRSRPGALKLASNENPLGPSPRALEALKEAAATVHVYPDGASSALREALGRHYGLDPAGIVVGNGSDEVLSLITGAYVSPGQNTVGADCTFSEYAFATRLFGGRYKAVPLGEGRFDLKALAAAVDDQTRVVFVCNPNNPTGTYVSQADLLAFLDRIPPQVLVVVDEAYAEYATATDYPRTLPLLAQRSNLVVLRTFSKLYGLAALRVGYALTNPAVARDLSVVKQPFNVGTLGQIAARAALEDAPFVAESLKVNAQGLQTLQTALNQRGLYHYPTQANFVAVQVRRDAKALYEHMLDIGGVAIRPLTSFGLKDWIRITLGTPGQIHTLLAALDGALAAVPELR